ncbi:2Fe-2S iron-sulfur cluster-binding protein [Zavarzinia sp.]|uniref:2Fe-2S iron-sulfur cluster-binding protein n=1 Tax=Zavarzinia sp. TaxID=2027920 RepID=UPI003566551D
MGHELTIEPLGETIEVADGQTILDACLRAGIWLPHACGHGLCGTCKVDVVDGEIDHGAASSFALMDFERADGKCLACTALLLDDVTIEAEIDEDPDQRRIAVRDNGDMLLGLLTDAQLLDAERHRRWAAALVKMALETEGNRDVLAGWLAKWVPLGEAAIDAYCTHLPDARDTAALARAAAADFRTNIGL